MKALPESNPKIPRKQLQKEMTNERSYSKVRLAKAPSKKQLSKDQSHANLKLMSTPELVKEIIPRLSEFPDQGRTIQVTGHNDSQIFANKRTS